MKQTKKFFYIDKSGQKKKYTGVVVNNHNGTFSGYLTKEKRTDIVVDLEYHPEIEHVEGYTAYYTYINSNNEEKKYYGLMKTDDNGNKYFSYFITKQVELIYHPSEPTIVEHYTFIDSNGNTKIYNGPTPTFENGSYYGIIELN
jgi:hypothetical protein